MSSSSSLARRDLLRPALDGAEVLIMVGPQQQSSFRRRRLDEKTLIITRSGTDERPRRVVENKPLNLYWWSTDEEVRARIGGIHGLARAPET